MSNPRSRSASLHEEEELRLPRTPGFVRRFWARHPIFADVLIALICLILSIAPATNFGTYRSTPDGGMVLVDPPPLAASIVVAALVLSACALLLRRRQWPLIAFVTAYIAAVGYLFLLEPAGGPLLLVASYSLAVYRSARTAWTGLAIGMGSLTLISFALQLTGVITLQSSLNAIFGQLALALIGTLIGVNVGGRKRYLEAVIDRSRQLLIERDQQAQLAASAERARIAREMHDIVSHSLTVIVALSEGAAATGDRERARDAATAAAATARGALTEMRSMLGVLRDGAGDVPLAPMESVAPNATVATAQNAGYPVTLTTIGEPNVSAAVGFAVGRVVQEGITNAMRHARGATRIAVHIDYASDPIVIRIENDGVTDTAGTSGFGLRGLSERVAHVNGTIHSGPVGERRWMLRAELPGASEATIADQTEESE
ncbi:sensor histidine kinase [Microbacterium murale]|uniref:histidine kinase n=1 Tax=Microbacterium murale TaxID=1081040 RepID=A0ABU0P789_9MICO|nr:histidine kinase [Microbacterium murale]MDQ0643201.1 signal transduction histidine kinase [Microbacterium murale]